MLLESRFRLPSTWRRISAANRRGQPGRWTGGHRMLGEARPPACGYRPPCRFHPFLRERGCVGRLGGEHPRHAGCVGSATGGWRARPSPSARGDAACWSCPSAAAASPPARASSARRSPCWRRPLTWPGDPRAWPARSQAGPAHAMMLRRRSGTPARAGPSCLPSTLRARAGSAAGDALGVPPPAHLSAIASLAASPGGAPPRLLSRARRAGRRGRAGAVHGPAVSLLAGRAGVCGVAV